MSTDPAVTVASVATTPTSVQLETIICVTASGAAAPVQTTVDFPCKAGDKIFLSAGGAGSFILFFNDPAEP